MPCLISGPINITSNEGIIVTGSTFNASPTNTSKVAAGSGGFNTGNLVLVNNAASATNTVDPDIADSNIAETF